MSEPEASEDALAGLSREQIMSALFAQLVVQQSNLAMMLLGKVAHPETGETVRDMEAARLFIDQLEMLEAKTKGNLTREEAALLKQSLMALRMAFVEAVESPKAPAQSETPARPETATSNPTALPADEPQKKFSKRY